MSVKESLDIIKEKKTHVFNTTPAETKISLVLGRFQPPTKGHVHIAKQADHPVIVAIVRGKKTSEDKETNPFTFETQKKVFEEIYPENEDIIEVATGYIPGITSDLRDEGYEVVQVLCGSDRVEGYQQLLKPHMVEELNLTIEIKSISREYDPYAGSDSVTHVSGTLVREALKANDLYSVRQLTGVSKETAEELKTEYDFDDRKKILYLASNTHGSKSDVIDKKIMSLTNNKFKVIRIDDINDIDPDVYAAIGFSDSTRYLSRFSSDTIKIPVASPTRDHWPINHPKDQEGDPSTKSHFVMNIGMSVSIKDRLRYTN